MRTKILPYILAICLLAYGCSEPGNLQQFTIKGSDTQISLTQQLAEEYMKQHKNVSITVVGGGSGVGISSLQEGTTDIAMSSRDLKINERIKLKGRNIELREAILAFDALAIVVHPSNPINGLTREQIEEIFIGKLTNWKELGGKDMKIVVYSRESSSGTYEFFKEHVMAKKNYAPNILSMSSTGAITTSISQTEGAIGYVGLAYVRPDVNLKPLEVSYDGGKTFVAPNIETAKNKTYPVSRPLYYFYSGSVAEKISPFLEYCFSAEGQNIVSEVGFVPVK